MRIRSFARTATLAAMLTLAAASALAQQGLRLYVPAGSSGSVASFTLNADGTLGPATTIPIGGGTNPAQALMRGDQAFAYVALVGTDQVALINTATNAVQTYATGDGPRGVAISPNGQRVYVANNSNAGTGNSVSAFNADSLTGQLTPVATIAMGAGTMPRFLKFTPDGSRLIVANQGNGGSNGSVAVIDTATNAIIATINTGGQLTDMAVTPDGTRAYVPSTTAQIFVIDLATNTLLTSFAISGNNFSPVFSADGTRMYTAVNNQNAIDVFDTTTNTVIQNNVPIAGNAPTGMALSPDGRSLYVTEGSPSNLVQLFSVDPVTGLLTAVAGATYATGLSPYYPGLCSSADALALLSAGATFVANTAAALDCTGGTPTFTGGTLRINDVAIAFTQPTISLGAAGGTVDSNGNTATFFGSIGGPGGLTKAGASSLLLAGTSTYSGATNVSAGSLIVNGSIVSPVSVASGAVLTGGGVVGATNVAGGGTLAPGAAIGNLRTGNLTLAAGSTLQVDLNGPTPGTQHDQVSVTGTAALGGATLTVTLGFTPVLGQVFTIINNDGADAVTGTFAGLPEGSILTVGATQFYVSYAGSGNDVTLTAAGLPGAPVIGTATPGNGTATIAFTPPASNGGAPITAYTVTCTPGPFGNSGAASPITVAGLANGTPYTCSVTATNAIGTGPASATIAVTPANVPGAPTIGAVTPGNGQATVAFTAPASNGGSPITGYTATCGAFSANGAASPLVVTGLTNGTLYNCSVTATNSQGTGPASATASVTPFAPGMTTYSGPSATGTGTITASFTGGGATCGYATPQFIGAPPGAAPIPPTAPGSTTFPHGLFDFRTTACTPGATLIFTITYPAALPAGTSYWKYGPTASNTAPHWYTLPATIVGNTATFTITDGGLGDDDLAANGTIVDQGGPGVPGAPGTVTAVPTLSQWMLILLMLLVGSAGARVVRQRTR
ncbi:IPTL-CTERM sorting domain-containing protein [Usitatibacter palustris]|uniref:Fibronectin type-III domain-containing protein n=1 Tax=Usitatibacter palustris TaxID=2732487 RepID=A0A6M4H9R0_9PROT|nr:IPTL-CTERM sorting domain-containing protein [Usitatibacter palustris]QJR15134.1 hypothetical protein DSM104440_01951 [Usitatibacter palustris]